MSAKRKLVFAIPLSLGLTLTSLWAQAPQLLNYQGKLSTGGNPAAVTFSMIFSIYSSASGTTALWSETQSVTVTNGIFNVLLGSVTPIPNSVFTGAGERYLGIKVGADPEMTPRFRLASVPFAVRASEADGVADGIITNADVSASAAIAGTKISPNFGSQIITTTGGVGIGTASPGKALQIEHPGDATIRLRDTNDPSGDWWEIPSDAFFPNTFGIVRYESSTAQAAKSVVVTSSGNVGIGVAVPSNILTVQQNSATDPIADAWTTYSSRRWKTNIQPIAGALEKVQRLRGVAYDWKADGKHDIGLIAEEVGEVIPEVVAYEENGVEAKSVDYARLVALLIEAMKEQQQQIETQRTTMATLVERISVLENAVIQGQRSRKGDQMR